MYAYVYTSVCGKYYDMIHLCERRQFLVYTCAIQCQNVTAFCRISVQVGILNCSFCEEMLTWAYVTKLCCHTPKYHSLTFSCTQMIAHSCLTHSRKCSNMHACSKRSCCCCRKIVVHRSIRHVHTVTVDTLMLWQSDTCMPWQSDTCMPWQSVTCM